MPAISVHANPLTPPSPDDGPTESSALGGLTVAAGLPAASFADTLPGSTLDGITITRLVAEGGMGRVYEGIQERPRRVVAVKVMRPGLVTATMIRRFEREADVLARLRHAGIAHVHAVGTHPSANGPVPYLVMEFVPDAQTILAYAEALRLSVRQRLQLFRIVCEAVAHAHRAGIVHRDLKPGNILVDGDGQPKVIDFGVARAIAEATGAPLHTETGQILGTVQYMSPEQFAGDPLDVDARSDVYALGVVLCELLTGGPPYDLRRKSVVEAARIMMDDAAAPPVSLGRLRGDLAVIVGTCLEKDRRRRYADAGELAADIGRHLDAAPIAARPPTLLDRLRRRARRHRVAVASAASFVAALILAMVGMLAIGPPADVGRGSPNRGPDALSGNARPAAVGIDATARAIYDKAIAAAQALRSLECTTQTRINGLDGDMSFGSPGTNVRARVAVRFAPADAGGTSARGPAAWEAMKDSIRIERLDDEHKGLVTVLHKGRVWQIDAAKKTIAEAGFEEGALAFGEDCMALPGWFNAARHGAFAGSIISCRRSGTETIDGVLCDVLEIVRGVEGIGFLRTVETFAIARRDGLPRRYSIGVEAPAGTPQVFDDSTTSIMTITDLVIDRPIDDALFEPEPSDDLKKVEPPRLRLIEGLLPDVSPDGPAIKESF